MFGIDDAIMGGLIGGGLNLAGSLFSNASNQDISNQANQFSAQQYATRYQTTVKDLQAAGLNPMMAYGQGAGSSPSGAVGHQQQNVMASATEGYQKSYERGILAQQAVNLAKEGELTSEKINTQRELTKATQAQAARDSSQSMVSDSQYALNVQSAAKEAANRPYWEMNAKSASEKMVQDVNEAIQRIKTGQASAGQYNALVNQIQQAIKFKGYDEQRLKNMSEAERSKVKQEISPYLNELRLLMEAIRGAGSTSNVNNYGN